MMRIFPQPLIRTLALALCLCLLAPAGIAAEETAGRVSSPETAQPAGATGKAAVSAQPAPEAAQALSAEESAELSARAEEPGSDVAGGALSNTHLTYIVIALAAAVIVLIAK